MIVISLSTFFVRTSFVSMRTSRLASLPGGIRIRRSSPESTLVDSMRSPSGVV